MSDNPCTAFQQLREPEIWVEKHGRALYRYALFRLQDPEVLKKQYRRPFWRPFVVLMKCRGPAILTVQLTLCH